MRASGPHLDDRRAITGPVERPRPRPDRDIALAALRTGDLLFFARPSLIQWFGERIGDPFRGVGIAVRSDEALVAVYWGRTGLCTLDLTGDLDRYSSIWAVALDCGCAPGVPDRVRTVAAATDRYDLASLVPAWFVGRVRERPRGPVAGSVRGGATYLARRHRARARTRICSSFVAEVVSDCGRHLVLDERLAPGGDLDRYVTPSDLWRAARGRRWQIVRFGVGEIIPAEPAAAS